MEQNCEIIEFNVYDPYKLRYSLEGRFNTNEDLDNFESLYKKIRKNTKSKVCNLNALTSNDPSLFQNTPKECKEWILKENPNQYFRIMKQANSVNYFCSLKYFKNRNIIADFKIKKSSFWERHIGAKKNEYDIAFHEICVIIIIFFLSFFERRRNILEKEITQFNSWFKTISDDEKIAITCILFSIMENFITNFVAISWTESLNMDPFGFDLRIFMNL